MPLTKLDASRGETNHRWPQVLPGGRFLYWVGSENSVNGGIYVSSLANPEKSVRLLETDSNAVYASGKGGKNYLLWVRGGTLLAQEFEHSTLKLAGEPHPIVERIGRTGVAKTELAASVNGVLLYNSVNTLGQFTWLDRAGKPSQLFGEPGEYFSFRLSPTAGELLQYGSPVFLLF